MRNFTPISSPQDGLQLAFASARSRRLRTASTTTTLVATTLSVVALALGAPGSHTLLQEPVPERPAVVTDVEHPPAPSPRPNHLAGSVSLAQITSIAGHRPSTTAATTTSPQPAGQSAPVTRMGPRYEAGQINRQENGLSSVPTPECTVTGRTEDATSLCPSAWVTNYAGAPVQLVADICSTRTSNTVLHYTGRNDVDFEILHKGKSVWRWSDWHRDGGSPHALAVATGSCVQWTFDWTKVDGTGAPLPAGDYMFRTTFLAAELGGRNVASYAFTLP